MAIPLTRGLVALVDVDDAPRIMAMGRWSAIRGTNTFYAARKRANATRGTLGMHRAVLDAPDGIDVDHIDGDGLNNRRENLRLCSRTENTRNRSRDLRNKSGFKGVSPHHGRFRATIGAGRSGRTRHLGTFPTAEEAARAYDRAAAAAHGPFARLNFQPEVAHA